MSTTRGVASFLSLIVTDGFPFTVTSYLPPTCAVIVWDDGRKAGCSMEMTDGLPAGSMSATWPFGFVLSVWPAYVTAPDSTGTPFAASLTVIITCVVGPVCAVGATARCRTV